jgi:ABC-type nickel/cobalt efflux system permease component RcnA
VHAHRHGLVEHRHLHPHRGGGHDHAHDSASRLGRSSRQAFGIGLVHGVAGSAGVAVLLLATIPDPAAATAAVIVLSVGTALTMAALSLAFGYVVTRGPVLRRTVALAPAMGTLALAFGGWYALAAAGAVPYLP